MTTYTLQAGRSILRDGKPFVALHKADNVHPTEADQFAHTVVNAVNNVDDLLAALELVEQSASHDQDCAMREHSANECTCFRATVSATLAKARASVSAQHTPGPFYLNGNAQMHGAQWVADATGKPVPMTEILRRCNAHDDMIEALTRIRDARDYNADHGHYPPQYGIVCFDDWAADIADTILANIRG